MPMLSEETSKKHPTFWPIWPTSWRIWTIHQHWGEMAWQCPWCRGISELWYSKKFTNRKFKLSYKYLLPRVECVPQLLLWDPAYPLLPYIIKEFENCKSSEEVILTQMLCSARIQIVCAFGRLKARWRILMRPMDIPANYLPSIVFACFVLST